MIATRILELLKHLGISKREFADKLGISPSNISNWININVKSKPTSDALIQIFEKFSVNLTWLLTGEGSMFIEEPLPVSGDCCQVMPVETEIAAGPPVEASTHPLMYLSVGTTVIKNVKDVHCFKVNGHSMEPEVLEEDLVVIKKANDWTGTGGKICAVKVNGDLTLKRVIHDPVNKLLILGASNKDYHPMIVNPKVSSIVLVGILQTVIRNVD